MCVYVLPVIVLEIFSSNNTFFTLIQVQPEN